MIMGTIKDIRNYEKTSEIAHRKRMLQYQKEITKTIDNTIKDVGRQIHLLQSKQKLEPTKFISQIKRNKLLQKQLETAQGKLYKNLNKSIKGHITDEWKNASIKGDKIEDLYIGGEESAIATKINTDALSAFINRKIKKITLSDRLWNISKSTQNIFEEHIATGITQGKSAQRIVKDLYDTFENPAQLLKGTKGQYKNVRSALKRLVVTETNGAFRRSDVFRMQKMSFVIGYITHLSPSRDSGFFDICDQFDGAKWPKTFVFSGFHANCRCYVTSILQSKSDFRNKITPRYIRKTPIQMDRIAKTYGGTTMKNNPIITDNYNNKLDLLKTSGTRRSNVKPYVKSPVVNWTKIKKK